MNKRDYTKFEKEDLLKVIEKLESRKKYGLLWDEERTKEKFEKEAENSLPVLKTVNSREINTDSNKPTNILIEGDNYHALSVLNYTHQGKIDVIYIDPPYNTGNKDFKYNDSFVDREDGFRHSKWLSFMSKRLRLAKTLLAEDGVIFISIGDDEYAQLKMLCDEIFGEENFLANISRKAKATSNKGNFFSPATDYVLAYAKNQSILGGFDDPIAQKKESYLKLFRHEDKRGKYNIVSLYMPALKGDRPSRYYIQCPDGTKVIPPGDRFWRWSENTFNKNNADDRVIFKQTNTGPLVDENGDKAKWNIYTKIYLHERQASGMRPLTFIDDMPNSLGSKELIQMGIDFPYSKPRVLIEFLVSITNKSSDITVLDFFAGSGTTGHAVLNLNFIDKGKRTFILCTNNEENICTDICYPRLKKAIDGYKNIKGQMIDGLGGKLKYFETSFVKNSINRDDLKIKLTAKCTEMLCLREGIFDELKSAENGDWKIFVNETQIMGIYFALERENLGVLKSELDKLEGDKLLYCFTLDPFGLNANNFVDWQGVRLEPIPQKILDIYGQIYEY